jgi:hypothetical protein
MSNLFFTSTAHTSFVIKQIIEAPIWPMIVGAAVSVPRRVHSPIATRHTVGIVVTIDRLSKPFLLQRSLGLVPNLLPLVANHAV